MIIRRYVTRVDLGESQLAEVRQKLCDDFAPRLKAIPGFRKYYVCSSGEGVLATVGVFDDEEGARESSRVAAEWWKESLSHMLSGQPLVTAGELILEQ